MYTVISAARMSNGSWASEFVNDAAGLQLAPLLISIESVQPHGDILRAGNQNHFAALQVLEGRHRGEYSFVVRAADLLHNCAVTVRRNRPLQHLMPH